jgi:mannose-1-phosphate guanylyltransferase
LTTAIVLAGGGGKRLWPLSTRTKPKFLLNLNGKSLVENTIERLQRSELFDNIVICSGVKYEADIKAIVKNYSKVYGLYEPSARDSMPAIILSAVFVKEKLGDDQIAIFPADHIIDDEAPFFTSVATAIAAIGPDNLVTIGVTPTFPSTAFGYIKYNTDSVVNHPEIPACAGMTNIYAVEQFVEKPDLDKAKRLLEQGGVSWNSGLFFINIDMLLNSFQTLYPSLSCTTDSATMEYDTVVCAWNNIEKISFDFGFVEKLSKGIIPGSIAVVNSNFSWLDIGDFNVLEEYCTAKNIDLSGINLEIDSSNNYIINTTNSAVALIGITNSLVVQTPTATLICNKSDSQKVKELVLKLENQSFTNFL